MISKSTQRDIATRQDKQALKQNRKTTTYGRLKTMKTTSGHLKKKFYQQMELNLATLYF